MNGQITIFQVSALSVLIPLIIGLARWRKLSTALHVFYMLMLVGFVFDLIGHLVSLDGESNLVFVHLFLYVQTTFLCLFFYSIPSLRLRHKKRILIFSGFSLIMIVVLGSYFPVEEYFNKGLLAYSSIVAVLFSFLYFYDLLLNGLNIPIWKTSLFYVVSGLLMYHVSNTGLFLTFDYFNETVASQLWQFKSVGYIFLNLLLSLSFFIHGSLSFD